MGGFAGSFVIIHHVQVSQTRQADWQTGLSHPCTPECWPSGDHLCLCHSTTPNLHQFSLRRAIQADVKMQHDMYAIDFAGDITANPREYSRYSNSQKKDTQGIRALRRRNGSDPSEAV